IARKIIARYFHVSDIRNPYGCDTPQTTPGPCANLPAWIANKVVYNDPIDGEGKSAFHDPEFPVLKSMQASASASASPAATPARRTASPAGKAG
ncbi:MAG: hypothetical protein ACYDAG_01055, partial [Chloroflexota bacterium]